VHGEQQRQPARVEQRTAAQRGGEDADELRRARHRDRRGSLTCREVARRYLGARVEHQRLACGDDQLTGEQPYERVGVDDPQQRTGRGERSSRAERGGEVPVEPASGGDREEHEQQRVHHRQVADRPVGDVQRGTGLIGDRRERQPEQLRAGDEEAERDQHRPAAGADRPGPRRRDLSVHGCLASTVTCRPQVRMLTAGQRAWPSLSG
jgi:hypothetical protein